MKQIYVVNLDKARILVLCGLFAAILGLALYIGSRYAPHGVIVTGPVAEAEVLPTTGALPDVIKGNPEVPGQRSPEVPAASTLMTPPRDVPAADRTLLPVQDDPMAKAAVSGSKPAKAPSEEMTTPATSNSAAPVNKASTAGPGEYYTLQVAAFKSEKDAIRCQESLKQEKVSARVEKGERFWLVKVGKSKEKSTLDRARDKLKDLRFEPLLVKQKL